MDPIFAAIAARQATIAACDGGKADDAAYDAEAAAIRWLVTTPPATLAGMKALLAYIVQCEEAGDEILDLFTVPFGNEDKRAGLLLLRTLLAALERL